MKKDKTEIVQVKYGRSVLSESMIFENGAEQVFRPIVFIVYLIKYKERRILIDAGCETMPGFEMTEFIGPIKALAEIGLTPEMITDVVITHADHDHIECVRYFKNAQIYIQQDEFEIGKAYLTSNCYVHTFEKEICLCEDIRVIRSGGHSKGSCIVEIDMESADGNEKIRNVIVGDECYQRECLEKKIPTGASYCPEKSRSFVEKYGTGDYVIWLCHEL